MTANPFTLLESLISWALGPAPVPVQPHSVAPGPVLSPFVVGLIQSLTDPGALDAWQQGGCYTVSTLTHKATSLKLTYRLESLAYEEYLRCDSYSFTPDEVDSVLEALTAHHQLEDDAEHSSKRRHFEDLALSPTTPAPGAGAPSAAPSSL